MRTFFAFPIPKDIQNDLYNQTSKLREDSTGVKWVAPENFHITLRFIGDIEDDILARLEKMVEDVPMHKGIFTVKYKGLGAFPPKGKPKVIYAPIETGKKECSEVYSFLDNLLSAFIPKEKRPYTPHITLGRVKGHAQVPDLRNYSDDVSGAFTVDECVLYESRLGPSGASYYVRKRGGFS